MIRTITNRVNFYALALAIAVPATTLAGEGAAQSACTSAFTTLPEVAAASLVIFGELHGTKEAPALVAEFVCQIHRSGKRVGVGLEIFSSEQPLIDAYLASSGSPTDRATLLRGPFWHRNFQDGRSSTAMINLIESLRRLKSDTQAVQVFAIASSLPGMRPDASMALTLKEAINNFPKDIWVVLVGNVHASKVSLIANRADYQSLAYHLNSAHPFTINVEFDSGAAWNCQAACGVSALRSQSETAPSGFQLSTARSPGFDAAFRIGVATASLPAVDQVTVK